MGKDHLDEEKVLLIARGKTELKIIGTDKAIWRQRGALIASSVMEGHGPWAASLPRAAGRGGGTEPVTGAGHHQPEEVMCRRKAPAAPTFRGHAIAGSPSFANSP